MSGAARHALEKDMRDLTVEEYQSDFARKYGLQGKSEGLLEGKSEGLLEGKSEGIADGIFAVLSVRKLSLTPDQIARINNNRDPEQLRMWLARATTVATAAEIFDPPDEAQTH
jgi:predicted transposase YdaD